MYTYTLTHTHTQVVEKNGKGGRVISRVGQVDLDRIAGQVAQGGGEEDEDDDSEDED